MQSWRPNRRAFLGTLSGLALGSLASRSFAQSSARVVVVGGGFAGATCARELQRTGLEVMLIEANPTYVACPLSNLVLASLRDLRSQEFGFDALRQQGIAVVQETAERVEPAARRIFLSDGSDLSYDRLVLAPGIDFRFDALPGYDLAAAENGGQALLCSDMFFGNRHNLILPGRSTHMGNGWETRRRRGQGHDWTIVKLATRGTLHRIEIAIRPENGLFICTSRNIAPATEAAQIENAISVMTLSSAYIV